MTNSTEANKAVAARFVEGFNTNDWGAVHEVVAEGFVFHHPDGGTVAAGPEGMVAAWSAFKAAVPDGWHPIPVMIAEADHVAVLLPTYGHFTGDPYHGIPPTGKWLEYGMVNVVRLEDGKLVEAWFGMDSLAEKQQMGAAPLLPSRQLVETEAANVELFESMVDTTGAVYDRVTSFGDVVVAMGPPQHREDTKRRTVDILRVEAGVLTAVRSHEFHTIPPFGGSLSADTQASRGVVMGFFDDVLSRRDLDAAALVVADDVLIHPTALPCEAGYFGIEGVEGWLGGWWTAFPDLAVTDYATVAQGDIVAVRWTARGTHRGRFMMVPPSGAEVELTGVSMYRVENGAIAEIWDARNTLGVLRQVAPDLGHDH
jgi:steroid delta-isomerase-like uncharacterized protein